MTPAKPRETRDPLVEEIRSIRRELSERFGNDVRALARHLQELEKQYPDRVKTPAPRAPADLTG